MLAHVLVILHMVAVSGGAGGREQRLGSAWHRLGGRSSEWQEMLHAGHAVGAMTS